MNYTIYVQTYHKLHYTGLKYNLMSRSHSLEHPWRVSWQRLGWRKDVGTGNVESGAFPFLFCFFFFLKKHQIYLFYIKYIYI